MFWVLIADAFVLLWAGSTLILSAWAERRRRPVLAERLAPFQRPWIVDEAEQWLRQERGHGG